MKTMPPQLSLGKMEHNVMGVTSPTMTAAETLPLLWLEQASLFAQSSCWVWPLNGSRLLP